MIKKCSLNLIIPTALPVFLIVLNSGKNKYNILVMNSIFNISYLWKHFYPPSYPCVHSSVEMSRERWLCWYINDRTWTIFLSGEIWGLIFNLCAFLHTHSPVFCNIRSPHERFYNARMKMMFNPCMLIE